MTLSYSTFGQTVIDTTGTTIIRNSTSTSTWNGTTNLILAASAMEDSGFQMSYEADSNPRVGRLTLSHAAGGIVDDFAISFKRFGVIEERFRITNDGQVGIGTDDPKAKLHIANGLVRISNKSNGPAGLDFVDDSDGDVFSFYHRRNSDKLIIADRNDVNLFALTKIGRLGIGTGAPEAKFHLSEGRALISNSTDAPGIDFRDDVDGDKFSIEHSRFNDRLLIKHNANTNAYLTVAKSGKIGIGTEAPGNLLHIGSHLQSNSLGSGNLIGTNAAFRISSQLNSLFMDSKNIFSDGVLALSTKGSEPLLIGTGSTERLRITKFGDVGIGTTNTFGYKLAVNGTIASTEIKVENTSNWPDFVFESDYKLPTLSEVEKHIKINGHLKDIPTTEEVEVNGILLGDMNAKLLKKIEELTLYSIDQEKRIESLEVRNEKLTHLIEKLLKKIED